MQMLHVTGRGFAGHGREREGSRDKHAKREREINMVVSLYSYYYYLLLLLLLLASVSAADRPPSFDRHCNVECICVSRYEV